MALRHIKGIPRSSVRATSPLVDSFQEVTLQSGLLIDPIGYSANKAAPGQFWLVTCPALLLAGLGLRTEALCP